MRKPELESCSVPSYFMQQQLDIQTNFAQLMFETVRKGDIEAVKRIERRIGLDIQFLIDGKMQ